MTFEEFFEHIEAHSELEGLSFDSEAEPCVFINHTPTGIVTRVPSSVWEGTDWELLDRILTCKREPAVLQHLSRIVGYFSRVDNWNESKLGELRDRHKGQYAVA